MAEISNYSSHKRVTGTSSADTITNYGYFVTITAGGGDDIVYYNAFDGLIYGGDGADTIGNIYQYGYYSDYYVTVDGGKGNDYIEMGSNSSILGGEGADTILSEYYSTISGGAGDDSLYAYDHSAIAGGAGNDDIEVYRYSTVTGGAGNDSIELRGGHNLVQ